MRKKLDPHGVFLNDYLRRLFCISVPTDLCASNLPSLASSLPRRSSDWVRLLRFGSVRAATPQCVWGLRSELETQPSTDQVLPALGSCNGTDCEYRVTLIGAVHPATRRVMFLGPPAIRQSLSRAGCESPV